MADFDPILTASVEEDPALDDEDENPQVEGQDDIILMDLGRQDQEADQQPADDLNTKPDDAVQAAPTLESTPKPKPKQE